MEKIPSVLLVDDDETTNFLNELLLKRLGVAEQIVIVNDGAQALALLTHQPPFRPALLLLDVKMPVMGGIEFLKIYQQLPAAQRAATVVIVLSTSNAPSDLQELQQLPIAGLLSKPLNREKIAALLLEHFGRELPAD